MQFREPSLLPSWFEWNILQNTLDFTWMLVSIAHLFFFILQGLQLVWWPCISDSCNYTICGLSTHYVLSHRYLYLYNSFPTTMCIGILTCTALVSLLYCGIHTGDIIFLNNCLFLLLWSKQGTFIRK